MPITSDAEGNAKHEDEPKAELIWVKSGRKDNRVALWERDPAHPEIDGVHETFVAGPTPVQAARTPAVEKGLIDKTLLECSGPDPKAKQDINVPSAQPTGRTDNPQDLLEPPTSRGRR